MKDTIQNYFKGNYRTFYEKYLPDVKKIGGEEYKALCTFHDDTEPSFNFDNQTGQYFCHGCNKKGDAIHFYAKINSLDTKRDFGKILRGIASDFNIPYEERKHHIDKTYDYTDTEGHLLYQVVRMNPKDFRQRRPGNNGNKWIWDVKGVERILYRLSQVVNAQEVLIVEGEKDADTLADLGLIATTCPMGAKKWRPEYNEYLRDKDIVLISDNDNEGREHMAQVGASLNGLVNSLKLIELPGLSSKGDLSDFIAKFDDRTEAAEKLSIMIDGAGPYKPPKKAGQDAQDNCVIGMTFEDLEKEFSGEIEWLWREHIPRALPSMVNGREGSGKTTLCLQIAKEILENEPVGMVVLIATEGFVLDTFNKMKEMELNDRRFQIPKKPDGTYRFNLKWREDCNYIANYLNQLNQPVLIVFVDSLRGASDFDANEDKMRIPIMNLNAIVCDSQKAACVWIHHFNKTDKSNLLDKSAGSPAITAAVRQVLSVTKKSAYVRSIRQAKSNVGVSTELELIKAGKDIIIRQPDQESEEGQTDRAEALLIELFKDNDTIPANEIFEEAEKDGILEHPLKDAKKRLGMQSIKIGDRWFWKWKI